jgi:hypothetical protein
MKHTKIYGLEIFLDPDMNGDGMDSPDRVTGCWIEHKDASCSLELLLNYGTVGDDGIEVPDPIIKKIEDWATAHGY